MRIAFALMVCCLGPAAAQLPPAPSEPALAPLLRAIEPGPLMAQVQRLAAFGTRHTASEVRSETHGIGAARRWIEKEWRACAQGTPLQVASRSHIEPSGRRIALPTEIVNVVATLPGRNPARIIVVAGHYDSRNADVMDAVGDAPGANDDASGTAAVMQLACTMARSSKPFDATLVFAAVAGEEQGLLGAAQLAKELDVEGTQVEAMVTNDIVGSPRGANGEFAPDRLRLFADGLDPLLRLMLRGTQEPSPRLKAQQQLAAAGGADDLPAAQLGRHLQRAVSAYLPELQIDLIARRDRTLRGGDHLPFLERGLAAVRFTEPFENYLNQHQNVRTVEGRRLGDLPQYVDPEYLARVTRANLVGLATLAWAPAPPQGVQVDARELSNDTRLVWQPVAGAAGYRVLWRRTASSQWEQARDLGPEAREAVIAGVSRDDVHFALQALSSDGHASLAVYAPPVLGR
jgi:Peptidase family M28